ncbi:hypothetical protein C2S52_002718 [Perilla frutescens var. hirtella]|nr:hypothetical protein C2S51_012733 [Perilla frutescens var. frutescens]KAH6792241.1 hypothetical protein C2S52_002718 [Perilla frutescens var. hirtella]
MADFFTDSDDDKAVEDLLSQAMDATVLEQVAAVNCAGFNDDGLPSHLETRFRKLKSFPSSAAKPTSLSTKSFNLSHTPESKKNDTIHESKAPDSNDEKHVENSEKVFSKCSTKIPDENSCLSNSGTPSQSPFNDIPQGKMKKNVRKSTKSPSFSSCDGLSSRSVSPPAKSGCFLCSPKRASRKKSKENRGLDLGIDCGKRDEFLSDLSNFSVNSRKKMIKKAMEEEDRICREAEKIVKWAKQASARMEISGIEDELSDDENAKFP